MSPAEHRHHHRAADTRPPSPQPPDQAPPDTADDTDWPVPLDALAPAGVAHHAPNPGTAAHLAAELLLRVVQHDEAAFARLYALLSGQVYTLLLRATGQPALAEELLEEVFWQVWRQAPRHDPARGTVRGWVMVIARSRALDALRRQRCEPASQRLAQADSGASPGEPDETADPLRLLATRQQVQALRVALRTLAPARRELVWLAYFDGLTQTQIAEHTGLPVGTVKSHLRRSLATLRAALQAADGRAAQA